MTEAGTTSKSLGDKLELSWSSPDQLTAMAPGWLYSSGLMLEHIVLGIPQNTTCLGGADLSPRQIWEYQACFHLSSQWLNLQQGEKVIAIL